MHKIQLKTGDIVPCGKCPVCKANERQEWIFRLQQEYFASIFSLFVTLTYDEENLPKDSSVNKVDVQLFHKRLRKHFAAGELRYYVVSEYGDHTFRPHYHGLYFFKSSHDKKQIYDIFERSWNKGFLKFGDVEEGSIVYCTKYCLKHSETPEGRKPTFRLMSKLNGGLGFNYVQFMLDYHIENNNLSYVCANGKRSRMPKYYKDKLKQFIMPVDFNDRLQQTNARFIDEYKAFLRTRHFANSNEAMQAFNEFKKKSGENQEELIVKHCKKQKF